MKTCGASDCELTVDVRDCYFDDGEVCVPIQACLACRIRLQELDCLTVSAKEDRPLPVKDSPP